MSMGEISKVEVFHCPTCQKWYETWDYLGGSHTPCAHCQRTTIGHWEPSRYWPRFAPHPVCQNCPAPPYCMVCRWYALIKEA